MKKLLTLLLMAALLIACQPPADKPETPPPEEQKEELTDDLLIHMIALENDGEVGEKIGCGDSIVPVTISVPQTDEPIKAALNQLLSEKDEFYGQSGLYNSLYQSNLKVDSVKVTDSKAEVNLSGTLTLSGICDNPRVEAQIEWTVLQFNEIKEVQVFLNGKTLQEALSQK